jgi:LAO/AO transport system kinase
MNLVDSVLKGERLALARLLSQLENDTAEGQAALNELFAHTGNAHLVGITGAPGTGKSSLVNRLAYHYRHPLDGNEPIQVAVVAVDPSSPFSGGAVLGDRVRMRDLAGDPGVFIRSMASRGSLGGLARTTASLVQAFDAAGFDTILIETVGAGQAEVDVASLAHTTVVVEAPGLGDDIQAIKAGILEIADILVVNKADRPGVEITERALRSSLNLAHPAARRDRNLETIEGLADLEDSETLWVPPIQRTIATEGTGIEELVGWINRHRDYLNSTQEWRNRERVRLRAELEALLREGLVSRWRETISEGAFQQVLSHIVARRISPRQALGILLNGEELP